MLRLLLPHAETRSLFLVHSVQLHVLGDIVKLIDHAKIRIRRQERTYFKGPISLRVSLPKLKCCFDDELFKGLVELRYIFFLRFIVFEKVLFSDF